MLRKRGGSVWTGSTWLGTWTCGELLTSQQWTFVFHTRRGIWLVWATIRFPWQAMLHGVNKRSEWFSLQANTSMDYNCLTSEQYLLIIRFYTESPVEIQFLNSIRDYRSLKKVQNTFENKIPLNIQLNQQRFRGFCTSYWITPLIKFVIRWKGKMLPTKIFSSSRSRACICANSFIVLEIRHRSQTSGEFLMKLVNLREKTLKRCFDKNKHLWNRTIL